MPSAKLTLDFDTRKFTDAFGSVLTALSGKKNSIRQYELSISQNNTPLNLPATTTVTAALKKTTDPPGVLLAEAGATSTGWGSGSRWFFTLDMTNPSFDQVLGVNVDFDVMIVMPDGQQFMSVTVPFRVEKAVQVP